LDYLQTLLTKLGGKHTGKMNKSDIIFEILFLKYPNYIEIPNFEDQSSEININIKKLSKCNERRKHKF